VIPRSPKNAVSGVRDGRLLLRVTAPPVDQAANEAVIRLLADCLRIPKSCLRVMTGMTSRNKTVHISGASPSEVRHGVGLAPAD